MGEGFLASDLGKEISTNYEIGEEGKMMKKLSWVSKLSFGLGAFGKDAVYAIVSTFLMYYLTDVKFVAPAFVGVLFLVARIFDAINDPLMGVVVDNTRSKWGRFRPWIMVGTVLNSFVLVMLYFNIGLSGNAYAAYVAVLYILWGLTYTIEDIPYWSMVPALTEDPQERDQISSIPRFFASCAWLVVGSGGFTIIAVLGQGNDSDGFSRFAMIIAVVFIVASTITCLNCKEAREIPPSAEKTTVKRMLDILFKNDQVLVMLGIAVLFNLGYQLENSFATYYFKYVAGSWDGTLFSTYTGVAGIAQMVVLALFPSIAAKVGRPATFFLAMASQVAGFLLLFGLGFMNAYSVLTVGLCSVVINIGIGFMLVLVTVCLADVVDYGEYKFGTRNEAIIFSMQTFVVKLAGAVSGFISGTGLQLLGFVADQEQSAGTVVGMRVIMILIPALLAIITYAIYVKGYKLRGPFLEEVKAAIADKK